MKLSIIIPVYNCDKWIISKINELLKFLEELKDRSDYLQKYLKVDLY